jgi:hypothetical protein
VRVVYASRWRFRVSFRLGDVPRENERMGGGHTVIFAASLSHVLCLSGCISH